MCGRFVSSSPPDELARYFGVDEATEAVLEPRYNVAPTNDIYVVLEQDGRRRLEAMHWGLVPFWADDPKIGNRMINARAESVATKNAYRQAFKRRRCIIPADGFYEWRKLPDQKRKQPYYIHGPDGRPLAFAGLWERWRPSKDSDEELHSCTIITGPPNETMAELHDRMPVILPRESWEQWLDEDTRDAEGLGELLAPVSSSAITFHPVSTEVNNPRNRGEHLIEEVEPEVEQESREGRDAES